MLSLSQIVQDIEDFQLDRALELLTLIEEAHKRYNAIYPQKSLATKSRDAKFDYKTPALKNWDWETDRQDIEISYPATRNKNAPSELIHSSYQVCAHLVFTQTVWSMTDLKNSFKRKNLFGFIARNLEISDLYVVFRGTSNLGECSPMSNLFSNSIRRLKTPIQREKPTG